MFAAAQGNSDSSPAVLRLPDCAICLSENSANQMFLPCRHVVLCANCMRKFTQAATESLQCPICRADVHELRNL